LADLLWLGCFPALALRLQQPETRIIEPSPAVTSLRFFV
jgi:hypothetical protein